MPYDPVTFPDGTRAIICSRGGRRPKPCHECGRGAVALCDWPTGKHKTCDRAMCAAHAHNLSGRNVDYCTEHWEARQKRAEAPR